MSDMAKDTNPIIRIGESIEWMVFIPKKAKVMPIANASMLVATDNASTTLGLDGLYSCLQSSSLKLSQTIFPPINSNKMKAIQCFYLLD